MIGSPPANLQHFLAKFRAVIIVLSGGGAGMEYGLDQRRVSIGRGPGVDLALEDSSLIAKHAVIEFQDGGFSLRRVAERAALLVNGHPTASAALKPEDQFRLGEVAFSYVLEPRSSATP